MLQYCMPKTPLLGITLQTTLCQYIFLRKEKKEGEQGPRGGVELSCPLSLAPEGSACPNPGKILLDGKEKVAMCPHTCVGGVSLDVQTFNTFHMGSGVHFISLAEICGPYLCDSADKHSLSTCSVGS